MEPGHKLKKQRAIKSEQSRSCFVQIVLLHSYTIKFVRALFTQDDRTLTCHNTIPCGVCERRIWSTSSSCVYFFGFAAMHFRTSSFKDFVSSLKCFFMNTWFSSLTVFMLASSTSLSFELSAEMCFLKFDSSSLTACRWSSRILRSKMLQPTEWQNICKGCVGGKLGLAHWNNNVEKPARCVNEKWAIWNIRCLSSVTQFAVKIDGLHKLGHVCMRWFLCITHEQLNLLQRNVKMFAVTQAFVEFEQPKECRLSAWQILP